LAFKNEKISEQDRAWVSQLVNYERIRAVSRWIHEFDKPYPEYWTADHERHAFLMTLGGRGSPDDEGRLPYAVLVLGGEVVVFNLTNTWTGTSASGLDYVYYVQNLTIPAPLTNREVEIRQLIEQALYERAFLLMVGPYADFKLERKNILSCVVNFK
jgi:hypothetical protein